MRLQLYRTLIPHFSRSSFPFFAIIIIIIIIPLLDWCDSRFPEYLTFWRPLMKKGKR